MMLVSPRKMTAAAAAATAKPSKRDKGGESHCAWILATPTSLRSC